MRILVALNQLLWCLLGNGVWQLSALAGSQLASTAVQLKDFEAQHATADAHQVVDWVIDSQNNQALPFLVIDKVQAKVFAFRADGGFLGATPALVGLTPGDESVPGIGSRTLASIRPDERTTPSGRFYATLGRNLQNREILWIDYQGGLSLHRAITGARSEQRALRLSTPTSKDNRITYGCINVPAPFFDKVVRPNASAKGAMVYILPETKSAQQVFGFKPRVQKQD